ncbi:uncharacterized protein K02A2.6-like [Teleopsis dalmanni]|uniref:uncharacterized protein K02A2.6-like n=1 Tax=Teleopsis dalmanni TaxID=139649 RepID=UPI0018CD4475|nr:uncharacterized protein K02A2.6-like [Teleopsis dalmanni]
MKRFTDSTQALPDVLPVFPTLEETVTMQAGDVETIDWGMEESIISKMKAVGLPRGRTSDLGFAEYCARNGISHVNTAPFHPASNGLAERFVRKFKSSVQKNIDDGLSIKLALVKYLATYRAIPNAEGKSPAELLHGRAPRTLLTLLSAPPNNNKPVTRSTKFSPNETVYIKHYGRGPKWVEAVIIKNLGCMVYIVKTSNGYVRRHQNQIKHRSSTSAENNSKSDWYMLPTPVSEQEDNNNTNHTNTEERSQMTEQIPRRSARTRAQPNRYQPI